jgi:hypothetical protein
MKPELKQLVDDHIHLMTYEHFQNSPETAYLCGEEKLDKKYNCRVCPFSVPNDTHPDGCLLINNYSESIPQDTLDIFNYVKQLHPELFI